MAKKKKGGGAKKKKGDAKQGSTRGSALLEGETKLQAQARNTAPATARARCPLIYGV